MDDAIMRPARALTQAAWRGRRVLLTGHTGFIGGWLAAALHTLGAQVHGFALAPPTTPSFFDLCGMGDRVAHTLGDVRDSAALARAYEAAQPDLVLHLAAQPLVATAHALPVETFEVNVMGTVNLLDCVRRYGGGGVVVMTSDKVYRHPGARNAEDDRLGGVEPYGGSKACAEVVAEVYARSFLEPRGISLATLRAGNVVGGGDWAANRLVPDAVRAFSSGRPLALRRPQAVRPWQHVLDAVQGLLLVAHHVLERRGEFSAWNVGPDRGGTRTVGEIAQLAAACWGNEASVVLDGERHFEEAEVLTIDSDRIRRQLGYHQPWSLESVVRDTMQWYRGALGGSDGWALALAQLERYLAAVSAGGGSVTADEMARPRPPAGNAL